MSCRCQIGDLAIVIREHPGCEDNLGKVVYAHRAGRPTPEDGDCWVITPVHSHKWWFIEVDNRIVGSVINVDDHIPHPDTIEWRFLLAPSQSGRCILFKPALFSGFVKIHRVQYSITDVCGVAVGNPLEKLQEERMFFGWYLCGNNLNILKFKSTKNELVRNL